MGAEVTALGEPAALHAQGHAQFPTERARKRDVGGWGGGEETTTHNKRSQKKSQMSTLVM